MLAEENFVKTTLISGDKELCKALLFEAAISWAKRGHQVCYFASKQIESLPLMFHNRSEPSVGILNLITFIYTSTYESLVSRLVQLYTFRRLPTVIILEDLSSYATRNNQPRILHAAEICACLLNSGLMCSRRSGQIINLFACNSEESDDSLSKVYKSYFDKRLVISAEPSESGEEREFRVQDEGRQKVVRFHRLDDAVLILTQIFEMDEN